MRHFDFAFSVIAIMLYIPTVCHPIILILIHSFRLRPTPQAGLKRVFTRRIPGADVLTHNDLIKVSAKIKLRKTNVPRSPGGTPRKECSNNDPFANALFHKFKVSS